MQNNQETLPDYFTRDLVLTARYQNLEKGEYLFRTGQKVNGIYFVLNGEMKAIRYIAGQREAIMMRAGAGEFFAESAIVTDLYSCDGVCVKAAHLAFFPTGDIDVALHDPAFARAFFLANAANARRQCSRYERVRLRSARDRVLHLLACETGPDNILDWPAPLSELAGELALEPETLYRVLAELERDGTIIREKRRLHLKS